MFSASQFLLDMRIPPRDLSLKRAIRRHVELVLAKTEGEVYAAAELLGVAPATVWRWIHRWALEDKTDGAMCLHCKGRKVIKTEGPDSYYKCLSCNSGFEAL